MLLPLRLLPLPPLRLLKLLPLLKLPPRLLLPSQYPPKKPHQPPGR